MNTAPSLHAAAAMPGTPARLGPEMGLYVHVPFCARSCEFCAFYQVPPSAGDIARYLAAVERELEMLDSWPMGAAVTVFFGGGTPGLLAPKDLERLCAAVRRRLGPAPQEWSVELAPGSVRPEKLRVLRDAGVTRVSLGVQSFQPRLLEALGRQHSRAQIDRAWDWIRGAGFASVNLDLMFSLPGQTLADWKADLDEAVQRGPDHLSTYCLTLEEDTVLYLKTRAAAGRTDPEEEASFQEAAHAELAASGWEHYEVSNYCRPGHACRHHLGAWGMGEWEGVGPAAASQRLPWRYRNPADLAAWHEDLAAGRRGTVERVQLSDEGLAADAVVFGLRTARGVDWSRWSPALSTQAQERLTLLFAELRAAGRLAPDGGDGWVRPLPAGIIVADAVGAAVLEAAEG